MADFDFSELTKLAADLGAVSKDVGPNVRKAIAVSSVNVKKSWQEPLKGSSTLGGLVPAVTFDISVGHGADNSTIESEIGFDKSRGQGPLGNISEFGSPTITGRGYGIKALHDNEADFEKGLDIATRDAEKRAGL